MSTLGPDTFAGEMLQALVVSLLTAGCVTAPLLVVLAAGLAVKWAGDYRHNHLPVAQRDVFWYRSSFGIGSYPQLRRAAPVRRSLVAGVGLFLLAAVLLLPYHGHPTPLFCLGVALLLPAAALVLEALHARKK